MSATIPPLDPGERLLCGPGPSNVHPDVLEALRLPMNGHLDPDFWDILLQLVDGLRALWRRGDQGLTISLSSSGNSAMEAGFMNLVDPGDTVISAHWGFFGARLNDFAHRVGAEVVELTADFGQIVPVDRIMEAVAAHPDAKIVSVVHAETSTGVEFPLGELADALKAAGSEALLYADCVTSLGGQQVEAEAWGLDFAYSCSQKALGCPPGLAPVTISDRAIEAMKTHTSPVPYYYDFEELAKRAPGLAKGSLAASALVMAARLDDFSTSATAQSMCAKALREAMDRLAELAPPVATKDGVSDLQAERERRRGGSAA